MSLLDETIKNFVESINFLIESRYDYLLKTYGEKLVKAMYSKNDIGLLYQSIGEDDRPAEPEEVLSVLQYLDPTNNKQYLQWLVLRYIAGNYRYEDISRIRKALSGFTQYKNRLQQKDINQYKGIVDVEDAVEPFLDKPASNREEKKLIKGEAQKLYEDDETLLIIPKTEEAACYYGSNTKWCTAAKEDNYFNSYNNRDPLYILIDKKNNRKFQFHLHTTQFMNARDEPVVFKDILHEYPKPMEMLKSIFKEKLLSNKDNPVPGIYTYAHKIVGGPVSKDLEKILAEDPTYACAYAKHVLNDRFLLGEPVISKGSDSAFYYARDVIKGRFPLGENSISAKSERSFDYAKEVIKQRFPAGEPEIAKNLGLSFDYAEDVIKGRFEQAEPLIALFPDWAFEYARKIIKGPFPKAEREIALHPPVAFAYAQQILHGRFYVAEKGIMNSKYAEQYKAWVLNNRLK